MSGEVEEMRQKLVEAGREREVLRGEREQERERRRAGERELRQVKGNFSIGSLRMLCVQVVERQSANNLEQVEQSSQELNQTISNLKR